MRWNRTSMAVLMSVICWCAPLMGAQEEPSCSQWNTEEFFETATAKDVAACLADGTGVGVRGESGITPLHWAAFGNQNPAVIQALLAAGADPMARPESGFTPLHLAAQLERKSVCADQIWRNSPASGGLVQRESSGDPGIAGSRGRRDGTDCNGPDTLGFCARQREAEGDRRLLALE